MANINSNEGSKTGEVNKSTFNALLCKSSQKESDNICIVRLSTNSWKDDRGVHFKKSLNFLKRKCKGFNILAEDCDVVGAEDVIPKIINLLNIPDGVYQLTTCNESKDWETGYVDDYDYKLVPA